ncbi:FkbM family methyltransferase [Solwaraspora sp. WMMD406]|uniref:FkbM family methyltransferase n=1 Tax=Solwaraspora sp. WMMD406 TaxID=3016095 RepID=UPI0024166980|nr:FkbM family methyltransferase [Solwaraspora sp. WMMD406]MDG4765256.1 FkbM family methyltransferase [Solwaraspora sp. WMMD406]
MITDRVSPAEVTELVARMRTPGFPQRGTVNLGPYVLEYPRARPFASTVELLYADRIYDVEPLAGPEQIIDGGGWVGLSVLRFRELFPDASITVFEPDPELYEMLCRNLDRNRITGVEPVRAALAGRDGTATFAATGSDSGGFPPAVTGEPITVPTTRLSHYLDQPVSLLKLNIEGAETAVVEEVGARLARVDQVLIEYHGFAALPQTLHQLLGALHAAGHTYVVSHFNERNRGCVPPLRLGPDYRYFLLVYARRLPATVATVR